MLTMALLGSFSFERYLEVYRRSEKKQVYLGKHVMHMR